MIDDQQTHTLPKTPDGLDHIARFCGFADTGAFQDELLSHLNRVVAAYAKLFEQEAPLSARGGSLVFTGVEDDPETIATLAAMGFSAPSDLAAIIRGWHHGRIRATRSARARELLTKLVPALLDALSKTADPQSAFLHFDQLLSGLPAGVQPFSLLLANPGLLDLIAAIAGSAPRLADYLSRNPSVLDALLDTDFLSRIPTPSQLEAKLASELAKFPNYELALDGVRRFNAGLDAAAAELLGGMVPTCSADAGVVATTACLGALVAGRDRAAVKLPPDPDASWLAEQWPIS